MTHLILGLGKSHVIAKLFICRFDEGAFDDVPDIDQNQLNNVTFGKQAILWISLLVGAPLNIIILIVTLSNWQRKFSSSALFVVHLCIGKSHQQRKISFFSLDELSKKRICWFASTLLSIFTTRMTLHLPGEFLCKYRTIWNNVRKNFRCIYMETSTQFFICLSVFSLAAIAFDRCVHLVSHTLSRISVKNHYFLFGMVWERVK